MSRIRVALLAALLAPAAFARGPLVEAEIKKLDARASDPDGKLVLVGAMADRLGVHRNYLVLLRRQTGQSYGEIFVSHLEQRGSSESQVLDQARALDREVEGRWRGVTSVNRGWRPVLYVNTAADHNSAGTFTSLLAEAGIGFGNAYVVLSAPFVRGFGGRDGIGDASLTFTPHFSALNIELVPSISVGFPTGDRAQGLGAGKTTVNIAGTVAKRLGRWRPFLSAGYANSVFGNIGYQRPYISDGNAAYFAGGGDFSIGRRLTAGGGAFAVQPAGPQRFVSLMPETAASGTPSTSPPQPPGHMPGIGGSMPGGLMPGPGSTPSQAPGMTMPLFAQKRSGEASPSQLRDYGANASASVQLRSGVVLFSSVARSVAFRLTTVRFGLGLDVGSFVFAGRRQ